jgi:excisionase family DNA binding protein
LRTFPADQLDGSRDQSECREPNGRALKPAPQTWLEQHLAQMADHLADLIAARLNVPPTSSGDSLLLTRTQLARALQVSLKTLDRWRVEGRMPEPIVIGGTVRWMREDIMSWLESQANR